MSEHTPDPYAEARKGLGLPPDTTPPETVEALLIQSGTDWSYLGVALALLGVAVTIAMLVLR